MEFLDYDAEGQKDISHLDDLEYFFDEHIAVSRSLAGMVSGEVLKKL